MAESYTESSEQMKLIKANELLQQKIEEHRHSEERLRESEEALRALFENTVLGVYRTTPDGTILMANSALVHMLGYESFEELARRNLEEDGFEPEYPRSVFKEQIERDGQIVGLESAWIRKDGSPLFVCENARVVCDRTGAILYYEGTVEDITERKHVEEELKRSEERYRAVVEDQTELICRFLPDGTLTFVNEAYCRYFNKKREELMGKSFMPFILNEDRKRAKRYLAFPTPENPMNTIEHRVVSPEGEVRWQQWTDRAIFDDHGHIMEFQSVGRDITERKRTEEALRSERDKLKALIDGLNRTGIGIDIVGIDHRILLQNAVLKEEFGDLTGKLCYEAYMGLENPCDQCPMVKAVKNNTVESADLVNIHGRIIELISAPLLNPDKTIDRAIEVAIDNTERIEAEKALRESQLKFRRLFMGNPEAAVYLDSDFHILDVNPRFKELFRYSLDEIKGEHINIIVPEDEIREKEVLKEAANRNVYHDTVRKKKDGALVSVSISAAPITVEDHHIGYIVLYKDISRLKAAEDALKRVLEKLETVNEKLRVVGSITRHDVRNRLSTIVGSIYLVKRSVTEDHIIVPYLTDIELTCQQIERTFDFARTYEKLGIEELVYIDVKESLAEAVMLFTDLNVRVANECKGLTVLADSLLRHLFYNLIDNSMKHGKTVSQIRVYYKEDKDNLKLIYEDDGIGIPKSEKEKIFAEAYGKDTGYGLYIVRKMCEAYHWTIQESGTPGRGVTFTMIIKNQNRELPSYMYS
jgi:PAS domain S-box-containing protein